MFVALVLATAAALAPAPLAKLAIDDGIQKHDVARARCDRGRCSCSRRSCTRSPPTCRPTSSAGSASARCRTCAWSLFEHLQSLSIGFYSRNRAGVIISRLTNDVEALDQLVSDGMATLIQSGLMLIGVVVILFVMDPHLALLTFIALPLLAIGGFVFRIASADAYRLTREKIAWITGYLQETLSGIRVVRAFGQEPRHIARFDELNDDNRAANMTTVNLNAAYFPAVELLSALVTVEILVIGGIEAINGQHLDRRRVRVHRRAEQLLRPDPAALPAVHDLPVGHGGARQDLRAARRAARAERPAPARPTLPRIRGELRFDDVSFRYGTDDDGAWALRDIDLTIPPGQTVALVGETGAGKSTLAKLVARFYDPTLGSVLVDGHDLRSVTAESLRSQMGIVPQEGFLFSGTVRENIAFGRPGATDRADRGGGRGVGAHGFIIGLENGYDTQVGERGVQLSAGQRQLIAFARALVADPRILVLDEATSNVDVHTETLIEEGLRRLVAGRTAIVIAHRLSTIRHAGRIVVLEHGRIVEQGTHDELLDAQGHYWQLYRDWAEQAAA